MELIIGIITGVVILVVLVVVHEFGHAVAARRNGVVVEEFGIGFPPRAWARKLKNGVLFSLNWLPIGGFVKLQGEHDAADQPGDYGAATFWRKTKILLAGVMMNFVVAAALLMVLAWTGLPRLIDNQFSVPSDTQVQRSPISLGGVQEGYPASKAGLQAGDIITKVDGKAIETKKEFISLTQEKRGETVSLVYVRDDVTREVDVALRDADSSPFGAIIVQDETMRATWSAPIVGVVTTAQLSWEALRGIGDVLISLGSGIVNQFSSNEAVREQAKQDLNYAGDSVAGPIGILGTLFPQAQQAGLTQLVLLTALISLTLAVMNLLPIPALDGGRWFTMAIYRLLKQPLTKEREEKTQAVGFAVLMSLILLVTVLDVAKFIG